MLDNLIDFAGMLCLCVPFVILLGTLACGAAWLWERFCSWIDGIDWSDQ